MRFALLVLAGISAFAQQIDAPRQVKNLPYVDVRTYGAKGDSTTDDTTAIQAALDAVGSGGVVMIPTPAAAGGYYKACGLQIPNYVTVSGEYNAKAPTGSANRMTHIYCDQADNVFEQKSTPAYGITVKNFYLKGEPTAHGRGVYFANCISCYIADNFMIQFGDQAILWSAGFVGRVSGNVVGGGYISSGRAGYLGVVQVAATDVEITGNEIAGPFCVPFNTGNCYGPSAMVDGYITGLYLTNGKQMVSNNLFEFVEHGIVNAGSNSQFYANHSEYNLGHGWYITGGSNQIFGNSSYTNGQAADNTYDGFYVTGGHNQFSANAVESTPATGWPSMRYGFNDVSADNSVLNWANRYDASNQALNVATAKYNVSGSTQKIVPLMVALPAGNSEDTLNTLTSPTLKTSALLTGTNVRHLIRATDAAADNEVWDISTNASGSYSQLFFRALNDSDTAASEWLKVDRTGTTINSVQFPYGTMEVNGTLFFTNTVAFSGLVAYGKSAVVICSDCKATSPTNSECAGSGGGSPAYRVGTKWMCMSGTAGTGDAIFQLGSGNSFGVKNQSGAYLLQVTEAGAVTVTGSDVSISAGAGSIALKDGSGNTRLGVSSAGVVTAYGSLAIDSATASRPAKLDANKALTSGKIDLSALSDVTAGSMTNGQVASWNGSYLIGLNIGTGASDVAAGNHGHAGVYASASVTTGGCATLAKLTAGGANGSLCWNDDGQITSYTAPN